jgi:hypothetical protein
MRHVADFTRELAFGLVAILLFLVLPAWWLSTQPELAASVAAWIRDTAEAGARVVRYMKGL